MTQSSAFEQPWYVFGRLPSGELLAPGETEGCAGPDAWGQCPAVAEGREPGCAGATWFYAPEPSWRVQIPPSTGMCPLVRLDPLRLADPLD
jgi:hypothetical protein